MRYIRFMPLAMLVLLFGCTEYYYYAFKRVELDVWRGRLEANIGGEYKTRSANGKQWQEWGNPYDLILAYYYPKSERVDKIEVSDVVLIGTKSAARLELGGGESARKTDLERWHDKNDGRIRIGLVVSALRAYQLGYEPYTLTCTISIYGEGKVLEKKRIEARFETRFKKSTRSDALDAVMGI